MFYTNNISDVGKLTSERLKEYCYINNYDFELFEYGNENISSWEKINICINCLKSSYHDYIVYLDADCLILNLDFDFYQLLNDTNLSLSSDVYGICCGFFIMKNNEWTKKLLNIINFIKDVDFNKSLSSTTNIGGFNSLENKYEQNTFKVLLEYFPEIRSNIKTIPETIIQNPDSQFNKDAFIFHFWSFDWKYKEKMIYHIKNICKTNYYDLSNWNLK